MATTAMATAATAATATVTASLRNLRRNLLTLKAKDAGLQPGCCFFGPRHEQDGAAMKRITHLHPARVEAVKGLVSLSRCLLLCMPGCQVRGVRGIRGSSKVGCAIHVLAKLQKGSYTKLPLARHSW